MRLFYRLCIALMSFTFTECFIKPFCMAKHNFQDIGKSLSVADKYFLVHSLINHIELRKSALLIDYCQKNLNYTNVAQITTSSDLDFVIKKHASNKTTLELFDIIETNAKLTDCYLNVFTEK